MNFKYVVLSEISQTQRVVLLWGHFYEGLATGKFTEGGMVVTGGWVPSSRQG